MLKNAWYPALIAGQLGATPVERTICDAPMVFFRSESGAAAALQGYCSHRRAPLALGTVRGDTLRCAYHGICFDREGRCVDVPTQTHVPSTLHIRNYPLIERYGFIWVWPGDAQLADPAAMPDLPWRERDDWNGDVMSGRHINASAELARDNLLDLTHIPFIHAATIGYDPELLRSDPLLFEQDGTTLRSTRIFDGVLPSANHAKWHNFRGVVKRTSASEWKPPGFVHILVRNEDDEVCLDRRVDHFVVPETATTHHYLYCMTRNFKLDDRVMSAEQIVDTDRALAEDAAICEEQQRMIEMTPNARDVFLGQDRILIQANKILATLQAAEDAANPASGKLSLAR
jgi:vanillate O-demethylase monooxygenase subunit